MSLRLTGAAVLACALALAATAADARPKYARISPGAASQCVPDNDGRQICREPEKRMGGLARVRARPSSVSCAGAGGDLVARARACLGTNPTGWRDLWCARFMAMIAPAAAARVKNPNWARDWAALPHVPPQVGAVAVIARGKGGHVGVVTGFDRRGNPIIVSGNHDGAVGEGAYPRGRVIAYVSAS